MTRLADRLLDALPQTQCTRCGYPDCAGYAEAIERGEAGIDQCPPGGDEGVRRLAALTGAAARTLNPAFGTEGPRLLAVIDEAWCIGCTRCLDACPTDAILGVNKHMHTVIAAQCTGCELCLPACPVDCIAFEDAAPGRTGWQAWSAPQAEAARARYAAHRARRQAPPSPGRQPAAPVDAAATEDAATQQAARKRSVVEAALARARAAAQARQGA
ncbi:RnfABCDGE type electron transport complex subunit B [Xenophilus sp. Marseille-Q4582]|uniref:RnfABCDGE type electron transport complex subunit B n=1 Tax=Xenophilus sp. Marseille-Q4582 TaxID=2866600 RepID=UPI001CE3DD85|nr:RnfABCDGE type electron transport complex subunit B [Xenophilus sp. Marseille-Q4582]